MRGQWIVGAAALVGVIAGGLNVAAAVGPQPETANVWVDPSGGSCVRTRPQPYSDSTACSSLGAAHAVARSGDLILVRGGTYPAPQSIRTNRGSIAIRNARGESPNFTATDSISIDAPAANITLVGLSAQTILIGTNCDESEQTCGPRVTNIHVVDVDVKTFRIGYVDGVQWDGGDVGPADATAGFQHPWIVNGGAEWAPKNITIDGVYFHDMVGDSANHTECLLITSADNVTVRDSKFRNCYSTGAMYITEINLSDGGNTYCTGVTVENNMFLGRDNGEPEWVEFEDDCEITIRNNSFSRGARPLLQQWQVNPGNGPTRTVTVTGNYGNSPGPGCGSIASNFVVRNNVWLKTACNATDRSVSVLNFVDPASDLHLTPNANAIDQGDMASYPTTDIDGQYRYWGKRPDAGADESLRPPIFTCGMRIGPVRTPWRCAAELRARRSATKAGKS